MVNFTPYEINLCLYDTERTKRFRRAIHKVVKPGDVVVDAGSGTGILGMFAAQAGAKRVYALELNRRFIKVIKENAKRNGFEKVFKVVNCDATKYKLPEKVDVIICELLSTGLFFEPEIQIINHLKRFLKKGGRIVPMECRSWIQLIDAQQELYGIRLNYDSREVNLMKDVGVTEKTPLDVLEFEKTREPVKLDKYILTKGSRNAMANAVKITTKSELTDSIYSKQTKFLFQPEIIHLKQPVPIKKDKRYRIHVKYSGGSDSIHAKFRIEELKR